MAVLSKEDLMAQVQTRLGEDKSDDAIKFLEDISDTMDDLVSKTTDTTDWETKYHELDNEWRTKYTERFYSGSSDNEDNNGGNENHDEGTKVEPKTFADLFTN